MKNVAELRKEALSDLQYDAEQKFKSEIKDTLRAIISQQKQMAECAKKIGECQAYLKLIQLEVISIEV